MVRRPLRVLVVLLTVAVTAGVVWRATMNEQGRGRMRLAAQQADARAADAIFELIDLRSSLHAYVAPGQGEAFWSKRAREQIASLASRLRDLEQAASAADHPLAAAASSLDGLTAIEARIRASVNDSQPLVAGDMIFTEARDLIDRAIRDLSETRQAMARTTSAREAGMANEQSLLAGALIGAWIFALILLAPLPGTPATPAPAAAPEPSALNLNLDVEASPATAMGRARPAATPPVDAASASEGHAQAASVATPAAREAPAAKGLPVALLESLASVCADIARVEDVGELKPLLGRASTVVGARGLVVWLVSREGRALVPAVAHGYDETVLARMGSIGVDDHNLTAEAFRNEETVTAAAKEGLPGAVAVPLRSASGASGVLAAEIMSETNLDRAVAIAAVIAAQLAGLFPAPAASDEPPQHAHAN
jgi:hypothetical protein